MQCKDWFIDADTHVTEPGDVWTSRLPRKFQEAAPKIIRTEDDVDIWHFGSVERAIPVGATAMAGWPEPFPSFPKTWMSVRLEPMTRRRDWTIWMRSGHGPWLCTRTWVDSGAKHS